MNPNFLDGDRVALTAPAELCGGYMYGPPLPWTAETGDEATVLAAGVTRLYVRRDDGWRGWADAGLVRLVQPAPGAAGS